MKYLLLFLLCLSGCSSSEKPQMIKAYACTSMSCSLVFEFRAQAEGNEFCNRFIHDLATRNENLVYFCSAVE